MALGLTECLSMNATCATFWAGWGVIATAAVGVVTVLVAVLAWFTSRRAAQIAEEATRIARQQKDEEGQKQAAQRRTLEQMLYNEVVGLQQVSGSALTSAYLGIDVTQPNGLGNEHHLRRALELCANEWLPVTLSVQEQLFLLNRGHGEVLARLVGETIRLRSLARTLNSRLTITRQEDDGYVVIFQAGREELTTFASALERFVSDAQLLASDFLVTVRQSRVKNPLED